MDESNSILVLATLPLAQLRDRLGKIKKLYPGAVIWLLITSEENYGADVNVVRVPGPYLGILRSRRGLGHLRSIAFNRIIVPYARDDIRGYVNAHLLAFCLRARRRLGMTDTGDEIPFSLVDVFNGLLRSFVAVIRIKLLILKVLAMNLQGRLRFRFKPLSFDRHEKNFVLLSYYFPPQGGPAVQRSLSFARHLPGYGWRPVVVAGPLEESLVVDASLVDSLPAETAVIRPRSGSDEERWIGRFRDLPRPLRHVPDQYLGWIVFAVKTCFSRRVTEIKPRAVVATAPPYSALLAGKVVSAAMGIPLVLDYRDAWTGEGPEKSYTRLSRWIEERLEAWVLSGASRITIASRRFRRYLRELQPKPGSARLTWLPNGYELDDFRGLEPLRPPGVSTVLYYMGGFFGRRSPEILFQALRLFIERGPEWRDRLLLLFAGQDPAAIMEWAGEAGVEQSVRALGYLDHRIALSYLRGSDGVILLVAENTPGLLPGKLYEYFASCKPIFAIAPEDGEAARLIRRMGRGVVTSPVSPQRVATSLELFLLSIPTCDDRNRLLPPGAFDRSLIAGRLARLLNRLTEVEETTQS